MNKPETCPLCGNAGLRDMFTAKDYLVSGENYIIKRCDKCGFAFTYNPPSEKDIAGYYVSDDYISHSDKKHNLTELLYHFARSLMLRRKAKLVIRATHKRKGMLIDTGSGTGYFASFMQKKGWEVRGIELNEKARNYSISKFHINVLEPAEIRTIADQSADCITFWHVLEHLYNPSSWMNEVKRILTEGGICLIALPNIDSADAKWFGEHWAALDVPRHLWHFSPGSFSQFIESNGFSCTGIRSLPLDALYISTLSYKNRGSVIPLFRGILTGSVMATISLFNKKKASSLIYIISRKQS